MQSAMLGMSLEDSYRNVNIRQSTKVIDKITRMQELNGDVCNNIVNNAWSG